MLFVLSMLVLIGAVVAFILSADKKAKQGAGVVVLVCIVVAISQMIRVVPAGSVGVIDVFGKVSERTLKSGVNLVNPFARVINFSIKTRELKEIMDVPSQEGLNVKLEISLLFRLNPEQAATVYRTIGDKYIEVVLIPQFRSVARGVTAAFEAKALYTSAREELSKQILTQLQSLVEERGIRIEATPLRTITLPPRLTQAIEEKLQAEQESQRMKFVLLKEKQEAERKGIEASGIADFQKIVTKGISEQLLRWKGIEATEKLANSQNTKVIIVGGKDGLPLIMDAR